jgi:hypothetical protein
VPPRTEQRDAAEQARKGPNTSVSPGLPHRT